MSADRKNGLGLLQERAYGAFPEICIRERRFEGLEFKVLSQRFAQIAKTNVCPQTQESAELSQNHYEKNQKHLCARGSNVRNKNWPWSTLDERFLQKARSAAYPKAIHYCTFGCANEVVAAKTYCWQPRYALVQSGNPHFHNFSLGIQPLSSTRKASQELDKGRRDMRLSDHATYITTMSHWESCYLFFWHAKYMRRG